MKLKTLLDQKNNFVSTTGGTWRIVSAPVFPVTLVVNSVSASYSANSIIGTGDPDVQWNTGELVFSYTIGTGNCASVATLTVDNINRAHNVTINTSSATIPFSAGDIVASGTTTSINGVPLVDAAQDIEAPDFTINNLVNGNVIGNQFISFTQYVVYRIQKSALPINRYIATTRFINKAGAVHIYNMPTTLGTINTNNTLVTSQLIAAYQSAWTYTNLESAFNISFHNRIKGAFTYPLEIISSANVSYIDIAIPVYFFPSTYTGGDVNVDIAGAVFVDNLGNTVPVTSMGLRYPTVTAQSNLSGASINMSCGTSLTASTTITGISGNLLGNCTLTFTNNSTITPTMCTSYTLTESSTPTCNNGTYAWKDNNGTTVGSTKSITVTTPGTYTLEYECDDCINCINTIPYVKTFTV